MKKQTLMLSMVLLLIVLLIPVLLMAIDPTVNNPFIYTNIPETDATLMSSGIGLLLVLGFFYAIKKGTKKKNNENDLYIVFRNEVS